MQSNFISNNPEDADFNQYWYSNFTISKIVDEIIELSTQTDAPFRVAFLSTPSLYFSLPLPQRQNCMVFDYDKKWENDPGFVHYDFNSPDFIPETTLVSFDLVVVDPPFITKEVWEKYATTSCLLLKPQGKVILTTVIENADLLKDLLQAKPTAFLPSIPNLVYQYNLFTNYDSNIFSHKNPEIPE
eukprot:gene4828-6766_t